MKFMRLWLIVLIAWVAISCNSEEVSQILITGTARYVESNLNAGHLPIKLTIYNSSNPFNVDTGNLVSTEVVNTDKEGHYAFSIDRSALPNESSYTLSIDSDSLVIVPDLSKGCLPSVIAVGSFSTSNTHTRDLDIDFPAFLQITFDKLDPSTTERVRLLKFGCVLFESTLDQPDTTILKTLPFHFIKTMDLQYHIVSETNGATEYTIADIVLLKNDTTKLTIEY